MVQDEILQEAAKCVLEFLRLRGEARDPSIFAELVYRGFEKPSRMFPALAELLADEVEVEYIVPGLHNGTAIWRMRKRWKQLGLPGIDAVCDGGTCFV